MAAPSSSKASLARLMRVRDQLPSVPDDAIELRVVLAIERAINQLLLAGNKSDAPLPEQAALVSISVANAAIEKTNANAVAVAAEKEENQEEPCNHVNVAADTVAPTPRSHAKNAPLSLPPSALDHVTFRLCTAFTRKPPFLALPAATSITAERV